MKTLCCLLIISVSFCLIGFTSSSNSLTKVDSTKLLLLQQLTDASNIKHINSFESNMHVKKPEGYHFMQIAVPDSTVNYHLRIKDVP